ncbi:hypothetical protein GCM10009665_10200 [Kitasatospora nipponensis]|uniref:Cytosolic fatty-acid binding proteins domain-containing protein n=1 Tax=Kitasatospora nipponensis TaxID=258049 RepID=A0ABP4GI66_9ACTN
MGFADFSGTYELASGEGYEEYLESIGVDSANRKAMASAQQTVTIKQEGDQYTLTTTTPTKTTSSQFVLGQEYIEAYDDGRKVQGICRRDGNRLVQALKLGDVTTTIYRSFDDGGFETVFQGVNVVAKRSYTRLA